MQHKYIISLKNLSDTEILGYRIAQVLNPGLVIALNGELGAGKTTLTRFMLQSLGVTDSIKSPTFTIVEPYYIASKNLHINHFDLYRFHDPLEWLESGFDEYFNDNSICIIEWANKADVVVRRIDWQIDLLLNHDGGKHDRLLTIYAKTDEGVKCLNKLIGRAEKY